MMSITALTAWTLHVMTVLVPNAPWKDTYASSAEVLVKNAYEAPLYPRQRDGVRRTLALDLAIARYESSFRPDAQGDCRGKDRTEKGLCKSGAAGRSLCMFQIGASNLAALGTTREEILSDLSVCVRAAHKMIRASFAVCRTRRDPKDRLAHYARGGETCGGPRGEGLLESRHRMAKARWIFDNRVFLKSVLPLD